MTNGPSRSTSSSASTATTPTLQCGALVIGALAVLYLALVLYVGIWGLMTLLALTRLTF